MRSSRLAWWLVRLYPLAWRARYEDEMLALVDARPLTSGTVLDLARGCLREHLLRPVGRVSPQAARILASLMRIPVAYALAVVIAWSGWFLANYLYGRGWIPVPHGQWALPAPRGLSNWGFGLYALLVLRAIVACLAALSANERFVLRRFELTGGLSVGFVSVVLVCLNQLAVAFYPWNAFRNASFEWSNFVLPLFMPVICLVMGTRRTITNIAAMREHRHEDVNVPASILGLNQ